MKYSMPKAESLKRIASYLLVLTAAQVATGAEFGYYPGMKLQLGYGFDPARPLTDLSKNNCFAWTTDTAPPPTARVGDSIGTQVTFDPTEVHNLKELHESLKIDSAAEARVWFMKGKSTFNSETTYDFKSKDVIFVMTGSITYSMIKQPGLPKLTPVALELLTKFKRNPKSFFEVCGTEIGTSEIRGNSISVLYAFHFGSSESANKFRTKTVVEARAGRASMDILAEARSLDENMTFKIKAYQTGASNVDQKILDLISVKIGDLDAVKKIVRDSLLAASEANSPTLSMGTMSVASMPEVMTKLKNYDLNQATYNSNALMDLQDDYQIARNRYELLHNILNDFNSDDYKRGAYEYFQQAQTEATTSMEKIMKMAAVCLEPNAKNQCQNVTQPLKPLNISKYLNGFFKSVTWGVHNAGHFYPSYPTSGYFTTYANFYPIIDFKNQRFIEKVTLRQNDHSVRSLTPEDLAKIEEADGSLEAFFLSNHYINGQPCGSQLNAVCLNIYGKSTMQAARDNEAKNQYSLIIRFVDDVEVTVPIVNPASVSPIVGEFFN